MHLAGRPWSPVSRFKSQVSRSKGPGRGTPNAIFSVANEMDDHPDVIIVKFVSGKVTFIHRDLSPSVITAGQAREQCPLQHTGTRAPSPTIAPPGQTNRSCS